MRRTHRAHLRAPDSRVHRTLALATAGLLTVGAGMTMMAVGGPASADPPGNNGSVMIDGVDIDSPGNVPHVDCEFRVQWFNFDEGDIYSQVTFELQAPTAGSGYGVTPSSDSVFVGEDAATGGGDLDAVETYRLLFTGDPQPNQGFHVKLTVNTPGSIGNDSKSKVFWVEPCQVEPSPTPTEEPSPTPTEEPSPTPTEEPSPTPTEEPTGKPTERPTDRPTVLPSEAETSVPTEEGKTPQAEPEVLGAEETLPSGVDAGLVAQQPANLTWGAGVIAAGLVMMAAAGAMNLRGRRRGEHQV
jgi:hypothetical protein